MFSDTAVLYSPEILLLRILSGALEPGFFVYGGVSVLVKRFYELTVTPNGTGKRKRQLNGHPESP